jgi:hypothetical protein
MARIALDQNVRAVAKQLGVPLRFDPTSLVVERCVQRVAAWANDLGPPSSPAELLAIVCEKLRLRFEVIETDAGLKEVRERYLAERELRFVDLESEFNATTDAVVIRLQHQPAWSNVRYVAVIDGRGTKRARIWFSKWHEIAHLLAEPQTKLVFRRTQAFKREPVERLMDQIAGALAFYEPLFVPQLTRAVDLAKPDLRALEQFAKNECSHASQFATLIAAVRQVAVPCILIEAKLGPKSSERSRGASPSAGALKLRAVSTVHNEASLRSKIFIHKNIRIPDASVIAKVFEGRRDLEFDIHDECLSWWESDGKHLSKRSVSVEAMRAGENRVLALCLPQL